MRREKEMRKESKQGEHTVDYERRYKIIMRQGEEHRRKTRRDREGGEEK